MVVKLSALKNKNKNKKNTQLTFTSLGFSDSSVGKEHTCNSGDSCLIPDSGRSAEEGTGYPLHYSWLPMWLSW